MPTLNPAHQRVFLFLRPNFSRHWLNYALSLIVFLGMFSISSFSYAGLTENNYFYKTSTLAYDRCTSAKGSPCDKLSYYSGQYKPRYYYIEDTSPTDRIYYNYFYGECPPDKPEQPDGTCGIPDSGCEPGQYKLVTYKTVSTYLGQGDSSKGIVIRPLPYKFGECVYTMTGIALNDDYPDPTNADSSVDCRRDNPESKDLICYHTTWMMTTGDSADPDDTENYNPLEDPDFVEEDKGEPVTSTTEDTEEYDLGEAITEMLDDGATVETQTETTSETRGDGATVTTDKETTTVHRTDGIDKVVTTTTTTITRPDGTSTTVVETTTEYTQKPQQEYTITENEDGTLSVTATNTDGASASETTTTTTDKDADGNTTGSSSTTTQNGDKGVKDEEEQGEGGKNKDYCKEHPKAFECQTVSNKGPERPPVASWWEPIYPDGFSMVIDQHMNDIRSQMSDSGFGDIGISGGGSYPSWSFDLNFGTNMNFGSFEVAPPSFIWQFISLCFMITTLWLCRALIFGG